MAMREEEYYTMAEAEQKHWWYRSLHQLVLSTLNSHFRNKNITIIDAGCGTGGLITFLQQNGYKNIKGFDISETAINICRKKNMDVFAGDIKNIGEYFKNNSADAVISNDTFYFLNSTSQRDTTETIHDLLKENGLLMLNLPSFGAFRGTHDVQVGIKKRFSRRAINELFDPLSYQEVKKMHWPFFLSPFIWAARFRQRMGMKNNKPVNVKSDVKSGNALVNALLYTITQTENTMLNIKPFGSSTFLVLKKI